MLLKAMFIHYFLDSFPNAVKKCNNLFNMWYSTVVDKLGGLYTIIMHNSAWFGVLMLTVWISTVSFKVCSHGQHCTDLLT